MEKEFQSILEISNIQKRNRPNLMSKRVEPAQLLQYNRLESYMLKKSARHIGVGGTRLEELMLT